MSKREEIKKELEKLIAEHDVLHKIAKESGNRLEFGTKYQNWYTRALSVVKALAPDRLDEFIGYYYSDPKRKSFSSSTYVIQDYIMCLGAIKDFKGNPEWDVDITVAIRLYNQLQILAALKTRIDTVLSDVTGTLFAELQDHELNSAQELLRVNVRAAGALAGVVLERHLQRIAKHHKIQIRKKNPTITNLNDPMKEAKVYDMPTWRKIQLLADIRNLCSHQKGSDPTKEQVKELISGVNTIIKSVF